MPKSDLYRLLTGGDGSTWERARPESVAEGPSIVPEGVPTDSEELTELESRAAELREAYQKNPERVLREFQEAFELDPERAAEFRAQFEAALERTRDLDRTAAEAEAVVGLEAPGLPENFIENIPARYRSPLIEIDPGEFRFEDDSLLGIFGWVLFNGPQSIAVPRKNGEQDFRQLSEDKGRPFRAHPGHTSGFRYEVDTPAGGKPLRVALFADFGTGLAHSRYIARQIEVDKPPCAVHLGDVYYTGTKKQFYEYFTEPLRGVIASPETQFFALPDNHEGYSGFEGYVDFLDRNRSLFPESQKQEGSYFAIVADRVQLLGVDTIWNATKGRIGDPDVKGWLGERLREGRRDGRANVLLTGHHPYEYGRNGTTKLFSDVKDLLDENLVDFWFWGNTHYGALFDRTEAFPFYGSCIGHGGYPYGRTEAGKKTPAKPLFLETGSRYEPSTVRRDRGMNGYCVLEASNDGTVRLEYIDWMGRRRHEEKFARRSGEAHLTRQ